MKIFNQTHLFLCAILGLISCSKDQPQTTSAIEKLALSPQVLAEIRSDPFSVQSTAKLCALMNENPVLANIIKRHCFGSSFDAKYFKMDSSKQGVRIWYCYNDSNRTLPKFFFALEHIKSYDKSTPTSNISAKLFVGQNFTYTGKTIDSAKMLDFISRQKTSAVNNVEIEKSEVLRYSKKFIDLMELASEWPDSLRICKFPIGFFDYKEVPSNQKNYDTFMKRNPKYVNCYLGLAYDTIHKPNYLRIILAGVDSSGAVIAKSTIGGNSLLQKSWPPPPDH